MTPDAMWDEQCADLSRDVERLQALLNDRSMAPAGVAVPELRRRLDDLHEQVARLQEAAAAPAVLWDGLAVARGACRDVAQTQLELLGGLAIREGGARGGPGLDGGFAVLAQAWLDDLRDGLGLPGPLVVIAGQGALLDAHVGIVRAPLLDWDLWYLPLLGRALGLLDATDDGPVADEVATAVLGPAYAIAVFALELDYAAPALERAAAILAMLRAMDRAQMEDPALPFDAEPYATVTERLKPLWQQAAGVGDATALEAAVEQVESREDALLADDGQSRPWLRDRLRITWATWARAQAQRRAWAGLGPAPDLADLGPGEAATTVLNALWRFKLDVRGYDEQLLAAAEGLLAGDRIPAPGPSSQRLLGEDLVQLRVERVRRRWRRLEEVLRGDQLDEEDRAAVAARSYRLLSEQLYHLERLTAQLRSLSPSGAWPALARLEDRGRPLQQEALELLGGLLVRQRDLDHEPARSALEPAGPSICRLADHLLEELAAGTGVSGSARSVLGPTAFLATSTDVIRMRFPDWSLWNLPVVAHEFGHVVGRSTPTFTTYQVREGARLEKEPDDPDHPVPARLTQRHLDELFADVFAVYALGPAFACAAILLQFDPAAAHRQRGKHPTHQERVWVILRILERLDATVQAAGGDRSPGPYAGIRAGLAARWQAARGPFGTLTEQPRPLRWADDLGSIMDVFYRLGVRYDPLRWEWAQDQGERLLPVVPSLDVLRERASEDGLGQLSLVDVLNTLWAARLSGRRPLENLTEAALQIGLDVLEE